MITGARVAERHAGASWYPSHNPEVTPGKGQAVWISIPEYFKSLFTLSVAPPLVGVLMVVVKSVDIFSWAKIQALFGIVFGLFYGILFAVIGAAMGMSKWTPGVEPVQSLGVLSIVAFPIIFAIMGFICGAIMALLYNLFAGSVGGVKIELVEK